MDPTFVFLHVGNEDLPELLIESIRLTTPTAQIIQCSDPQTTELRGVSRVFRLSDDTQNLMTFRLACFSKLGLTYPAVYLDADMLVCRSISPENLSVRFNKVL